MSKDKIFVYLLYFLATGYLVFLVSSTQPNVFYSGDGGLKFMAVRQICAGEDFRYITHTQPQWVEQVWAQGFFPIKIGFVMPGEKGYYFVFAPAYQFISAFLYQKIGYWGLYLIPFISTLVLWVWFIRTALTMQFSRKQTAAMFFLLVFCSPLTLYGAVYWEHMLAVLLTFSGIFFFLHPSRKPLPALALGLASGLSVWLRPESLLLNMLLVAAIVILHVRSAPIANWRPFTMGTLTGTAGFLVFNKIEYGIYFGVHGSQALGSKHYFNWHRIVVNIGLINLLLIKYFSIVLLLAPILLAWWKFKWRLPAKTIALIAVVITFCLLAPLLFPNDGGRQWGPRFFLSLLPAIIFILFSVRKEWQGHDWRRYRPALLTFIVLAVGYSLVLNTVVGASSLRDENLGRISPVLDFVKQDPGKTVVVNSDYITIELGALYREKNFFVATDTAAFNKLTVLLKQHGVDHFVYINDNLAPPGFDNVLSAYKVQLISKGTYRVGVFPL